MQPPRRRSPRFDLRGTETLRGLVLNGTALLTSLLILRFATLVIGQADEAAIPSYIRSITYPLVWPFHQLPLLSTDLGRDVLAADVFVIVLVFLAGLLSAGILTGWRESSQRPPHHTEPYG